MLEQRYAKLQDVVLPQNSTVLRANNKARRAVVLRQLDATDQLFDRLRTLQPYFPFEFRDIHLPDRWPTYYKAKRFVPFLIAGALKTGLSLFSTINGLYSRQELKQLRLDLNGVISEQQRVVTLTNNNTIAIQALNSKLVELSSAISEALEKNPALDVVEIDHIIDSLHRAIDLIVQTVQQAQQNRLAIEFLSPTVLQETFKDVSDAATVNQATLMIDQAADLAQVEVSYMSDRDGTIVILHVPMIPSVALLRLMRLRPFPIPLDDHTMLLPEVDFDVIGISTSEQTLSAEIRYSDLLDCHKIGQTYFCEKQGVLARNADTCLTALHYQKLEKAMSLCELRVTNATEAALQTGNNRFLIYSPIRATAPRVCTTLLMGASVDIPKGISEIELRPGCYVDLPEHRIYADASVRTASNQFSYLWDWDGPVQQLGVHPKRIASLVTDLKNFSGPLHLQDVLGQLRNSQHLPLLHQLQHNLTTITEQTQAHTTSRWIIFLAVIGAFALLLLLTVITVAVIGLRFRSRLARFSHAFRELMRLLAPLKAGITSTRLYPNLDQGMTSINRAFRALADFASSNARRITSVPNPTDKPADSNNDNGHSDSGVNLSP